MTTNIDKLLFLAMRWTIEREDKILYGLGDRYYKNNFDHGDNFENNRNLAYDLDENKKVGG